MKTLSTKCTLNLSVSSLSRDGGAYTFCEIKFFFNLDAHDRSVSFEGKLAKHLIFPKTVEDMRHSQSLKKFQIEVRNARTLCDEESLNLYPATENRLQNESILQNNFNLLGFEIPSKEVLLVQVLREVVPCVRLVWQMYCVVSAALQH